MRDSDEVQSTQKPAKTLLHDRPLSQDNGPFSQYKLVQKSRDKQPPHLTGLPQPPSKTPFGGFGGAWAPKQNTKTPSKGGVWGGNPHLLPSCLLELFSTAKSNLESII